MEPLFRYYQQILEMQSDYIVTIVTMQKREVPSFPEEETYIQPFCRLFPFRRY